MSANTPPSKTAGFFVPGGMMMKNQVLEFNEFNREALIAALSWSPWIGKPGPDDLQGAEGPRIGIRIKTKGFVGHRDNGQPIYRGWAELTMSIPDFVDNLIDGVITFPWVARADGKKAQIEYLAAIPDERLRGSARGIKNVWPEDWILGEPIDAPVYFDFPSTIKAQPATVEAIWWNLVDLEFLNSGGSVELQNQTEWLTGRIYGVRTRNPFYGSDWSRGYTRLTIPWRNEGKRKVPLDPEKRAVGPVVEPGNVVEISGKKYKVEFKEIGN